MFRKIRNYITRVKYQRRFNREWAKELSTEPNHQVTAEAASFNREEMLQMYNNGHQAGVAKGIELGYARGKADGLAQAKAAAIKQLNLLTRS